MQNVWRDVHKPVIRVRYHAPVLCFNSLQPVLSIDSFIPFSFLSSCNISAKSFTPNVRIQSKSSDIVFLHRVCVKRNLYVKALVTFSCDGDGIEQIAGQVLPFNFILRKDGSSPSGVSRQKFEHRIRSRSRSRRRRQVSNSHPAFDPKEYTVHVEEEQEPGQSLITITATDSDSGDAGKLTYRMDANSDTRSQTMFSINPNTGTIKTNEKLDREQMGMHYFTISAIDKVIPESDRLTATASLTIIVDDVNDHKPEFQPVTNTISVNENGRAAEIFLANAIDADAGDNKKIRYSILNPESPNDVFIIDPEEGYISTRRALDREKVARYILVIQAVDQGKLSERKTSTMSLTVNVKDDNDNSPVFTGKDYILNLREDRAVSRTKEILRLTATDKDEGKNAEVTYRFSQRQDDFMINRTTGYLYLIRSLDYEDTESYSLSIRAEDQGTPAKFQLITVLVNVIDINDNDPEFIQTSYIRNVDEDIGEGARVIQVSAFDKDSDQNSRLTYSIIPPTDGVDLPFEINSQDGWITTTTDLDRETVDRYTFVVKVEDNGSNKRSASASVTIGLRDVNDNPPVFEERRYNASISEEARKEDPVINVIAKDIDQGDNARVQYRIERGNDNDAFRIRMIQGEGVIVVNKKLDARTQNKYVLTVSATDLDGKRDSVQVFITVRDTNRHAPEFQRKDTFQFEVKEDTPIGTSVFEVLALDRDRDENARITYSLTSLSTDSVFSIEPDTGIIKTQQKLDQELSPDYTLFVKATDHGKPAQSDEAEILVTVTDVNDNSPEFTEHMYTGSVSESKPIGTNILKISADDRDKGINGDVRYTFEGGDDGDGTFNIDNQGWVYLAKTVDRETKAEYDLVAIAKDSDPVEPQSSSVQIRIEVLDVNDNSPIFDFPVYNVMVEENSPVPTEVARITANDPDEGINKLVEYSFGPGSDSEFFELTGKRGDPAIITTRKNLDYEKGKHRYRVILRARSDTLISTAQVFINVQDLNDNIPVFEDFSIIYNNFVASFPNGPIGKVPAFDPDVSDRDRLVYKILSGNEAELIHLNETSGEVTLDRRLNSDVPREGQFRMSVTGELLTFLTFVSLD